MPAIELPETKVRATHIGQALAKVLDDAAGRPVAGIVLVSDGQNTGGPSPVQTAHTAGELGVPIYPAAFGTPQRLQDVSLVDVFTTGLVSMGDTAKVAVTIESQGFDNRTVKVELIDGENTLDSKDLTLRSTEQQQIELTFEATEPGPRYLTVRIAPLPEEPEHLHSNNTDVALVQVSEEKIKVLYLAGHPVWDFRFLKNAMRRDHGLAGRAGNLPDVLLEAELRRRGPDAAANLMPQTLDELAEYHTVILGDVSPNLAVGPFVQMLSEAVRDRGVGLIVQAGPRHMPHAFDDALHELLPVGIRPGTAGLMAPDYKPFRLDVTAQGAVHDAMRLYDDMGRNQRVWSHMPAYHWCAAVDRASPAAVVLAADANVSGRYGKLPVIAQQETGKGKVLFVGVDSTWRWRQNVGDRFFYKFWGQAIRSVARGAEDTDRESHIIVRPLRLQVGDEAQIELLAVDAEDEPRSDAKLSVHVLGGGEDKVVQLLPVATKDGRYAGNFIPKLVGDYRVVFEPGGAQERTEARFRVADVSEELRHPNINHAALEMIADASGGQMVELIDLGAITDQLSGESRASQLYLEAAMWDNWLVLVVLIVVYCTDVGLRRMAGLA